MATSNATETNPAAGEGAEYIIDGDAHVLEPPHLWVEYLEPEFRARAIRITQSIEDHEGRPPDPGSRAPDAGDEAAAET